MFQLYLAVLFQACDTATKFVTNSATISSVC
jgi:hypothetical protein